MKKEKVYCGECKHSKFEDYGIGWFCRKTEKPHPIYRQFNSYESCFDINKNNNCKKFQPK